MSTPLRAQLRLALVLYGGASLAVYMNGVAQEILALVRAAHARRLQGDRSAWAEAERLTNPYVDLLAAAELDVDVDVIAGTSAGGLNALMLAKALAAGSPDLGPLQKLWEQAAQIEKLALADRQVTSLLSGEYLRARLESVLQELEAAGRPEVAALVPALDLFITATDLRGHLWAKRDRTGKRLEGVAHKWVFRLKRRPDDCQLTANDPDLRERRNHLLSKVGQATSAFPAVFPPVSIDRKECEAAGLPLLDGIAADQVWFSDGGILANKPFKPVLQTLSQRGSMLPTIRVLAYLEPDPSLGNREESQVAPSALGAALAGVSLPMAQDIQEELGRLAAENERRERLDAALTTLEEALLRSAYDLTALALRPALRESAAASNPPETAAALQGPNPVDEQAPGALQLDRGLRLPPDPFTETRGDSLDLNATAVYRSMRLRSLRDWLQNLLEEGLTQGGPSQQALITETLWVLGLRPGSSSDIDLLSQIDLLWGQRRLLFLIDRVNRHYRADTQPKKTEAISRFWQAIWAALDVWLGGRKRAVAALKEVPAQASPAVVAGALRLTLHTQVAEAEALEEEALAAAREAFPLRHADGSLVQALPGLLLDADLLTRLYAGFAAVDITLLPLLGYTGSLETEPIRVYRLSPDGSTWGSTPGVEKLAGNAFDHFGAFFDEAWRQNDLLRGRLDAAEQLFRMVALESGLIQLGPDGQPPPEATWPTAVSLALDQRRRQALQAFPSLVSAQAIMATVPKHSPEAAALAPDLQGLPSSLIERWVATSLQPQPLPPPRLAGSLLLLLQNLSLTLRESGPSPLGSALQRTLLVVLTPFVWIARLLLMPGEGIFRVIQANLGPLFTAAGLALIAGDATGLLNLRTPGWWLAAALLTPVLLDALFDRSPAWIALFAVLTGLTGVAWGGAQAWFAVPEWLSPLARWAPLAAVIFAALVLIRLHNRDWRRRTLRAFGR